jgi:tol-pal system beta propeller repeat protein TolB
MRFRKPLQTFFERFCLRIAGAVAACVVLALYFSQAVGQPVTLRVETTAVGRVDVVIEHFIAARDSAFAGSLPANLRDQVKGDLAYSGYFNVLEPEDAPLDTVTRVRQSGNKSDTLRTLSGPLPPRVHGSVTAGWNGATASMAIYQPPLKDPIHQREFQFKADDSRTAAHTIASWITQMLTGEQGAFLSKIAFVVKTGTNKNIWVMDWDGANPHAITRDQTTQLSPTWSPDGNTIYFTSFRGGNADIYRMDAEGKNIRPFFASPYVDSAPSVSPDGEWVAFSSAVNGNPEIYRAHPDGTRRTELTFSYGVDTSPSWSPTGQYLVFTSDRAGSGSPQIYRMDFEGTNVQRLTYAGNYNETARWSPRGDLIAYASREIGFQIFTIGPDGNHERRVTSDGSNLDPSWSPDGMKLVYTSIRGNKSSIWTCNWDGTDQRQLTFGLDASQPQWGPAPLVAESGD